MIGHGRKSRQVVEKIGGASRDRTDDLIVANDALSQLSYSPTGRLDRWLADFISVCFPAPSARIDPHRPTGPTGTKLLDEKRGVASN